MDGISRKTMLKTYKATIRPVAIGLYVAGTMNLLRKKEKK